MKKLKKILLYSFYVFSLICVIYTINKPLKNEIKQNEVSLKGTIIDYKIKEDYTEILVNSGELILCYYKDNINLKLGTKIELIGTYSIPSENTNFGLFNYRKYLLSKKINYIFNAKKINIINSNIYFFYKIKNYIIDRINKSKNKNYLELFILGKNNLVEIKNIYQELGISHLFAISGMHITLFTTFLSFVLFKINKNKKINFILISMFLFFYMFLTNYTASVLRASFLFIFLNLKKILNINISNINLLLIICCLLLIYNPFYLYDLGFLFSFTISFSLIKYSYIINKFNNYFVKIFITSLISFLFSIPIIILNINQINLLSPLVNCIFVPFVSLVLFPISLLTFIFLFLDDLLFLLISLMEKLAYFICNFSLIVLIPKVNFFLIFIYIILLILILKKITKYKLILFLLFLVFLTNINFFNYNLKVTIIDIKQGDSILLEFPNNKGNIFIDIGSNKNKDFNNLIYEPILKMKGISKINYLILTHGDYDHMGEAVNLVNNFKVENVIFNCGKYNDLEKELISVLEKKNINYYSCIKELNIDKYKLQFLNTGVYDNENDNSSVTYLTYNNYKFLFMGDAGVIKEKDILEKYNLNDIDFLKVGHHGSNTSSSEEFINSVNPKYSLISVGKNNRYGHPKESVLDILENTKIYRTDLDGSIEIKLNKNGYKISTCSP